MSYQATASGTGVQGIHSLFSYVNSDGDKSGTNCGLAAAATALRFEDLYSQPRLIELEKSFPPDILWGVFGSSKSRVLSILDHYGCYYREIKEKPALKMAIGLLQPVIVMLQLSATAAHWTVAFAYNDDHICLTNYWDKNGNGQMTWKDFDDNWNGAYPSLISMANTGIAIKGVKKLNTLPDNIA